MVVLFHVGGDNEGAVPSLEAEDAFGLIFQPRLADGQADIGQEKEVPVGLVGLRVVHVPRLQCGNAGTAAFQPVDYFADGGIGENSPDDRCLFEKL